MKTLIMLAIGCLFTIATMAADRNPSVTIKSKRNFIIVVDGKHFRNDNSIHLRNLRRGFHTIKVYERRGGFFRSQMRLVSSRNFIMRNSDLRIEIDRFGRMDFDESHNGRGRDRDWSDNHNRSRDRNRKF